ncbi:hypothetical protein Esti_003910 [Eimeria stiedai]
MGSNLLEAGDAGGEGAAAARQLSCFHISKRGRVRKVVREVYLRDDVPCGIKGCYLCGDPSKNAGLLRADQRLLFPDASCLLTFIDFVETDPCVRNCVILSTVLNQVRAKSLQVYGRLRVLCGASAIAGDANKPQKGFHIFSNEFFSQTFVEPNPDETMKAYEARCMCVAAEWLQRHLSVLAAGGDLEGEVPKVTLLTFDEDLKERAEATGLSVQNVHEYLDSVKDEFPNSGEQLAQLGESNLGPENGSRRAAFYEVHWTEHQINEGLKTGRILQGKLRMVADCSWRGLVFAAGEEVRVVGRQHLNRAFEGDVVAVEILSADNEGKAPNEEDGAAGAAAACDEVELGVSADLKDVDEEAEAFPDEDGEATAAAATAAAAARAAEAPLREGRVVGIIRRGRREFCGTLKPIDDLKGLSLPCLASVERVFVAADRRVPNVLIKTRQSQGLDGKRLVVAVDSWDRFHRLPRGHWVEILGAFGDRKAEGDLILRENGITQREFSSAALRCLPPPDWTPALLSEGERSRRLDMRNVLTCSIDPPGCKDIDDALSIERILDNCFRVGVHIADVTHFLRPDTQLDVEAAERCNTVYLVERRTDMLPALLTTDLCSLVGGRERLAFSVLWEMDAEANILNTTFHKTIIKSTAALTYQEAQSLIDDPHDKSPLATNLRALLRLSQHLRRRRVEAGGLQLASPDVQVIREALSSAHAEGRIARAGDAEAPNDVSAETVEQEAVDIALYQARETNKMVEDYMLLANVSVARKIESAFPRNSLLRRHPSPKTTSLETLKQLLEARGIKHFDYSSAKALSASLDRIAKKYPSLDFLLRVMTTRCMNQALYFSSADAVAEGSEAASSSSFFHHYGLAADIYTHFTSPIRRYADVVVHRLLAAALDLEPIPPIARSRERLKQQCEQLNLKHRAAQIAGRQSVQFYVYLYFVGKGPQEVTAVITKIKKNGALVYVHEYGLEGVVFVGDQLLFDPETQELVRKDGSTRHSVFSRIRVLAEAQSATDFRPTVTMTYLGSAN